MTGGMNIYDSSLVPRGTSHETTFSMSSGYLMKVEWDRVSRREDKIADDKEAWWRVSFWHGPDRIAVHFQDPAADPTTIESYLWMYGVITHYEPPKKPEPPRRGLLWHLLDGVDAWRRSGR